MTAARGLVAAGRPYAMSSRRSFVVARVTCVDRYPAAATARTGTSAAGAEAIVQAVDRRWVMIEAAKLEGHDGGQIAVTLRAATATETFKLLYRARTCSAGLPD
jgi:hypothetical protein